MLTFMAHWYLFVILNFLAGANALLWGIRCTSSRKGLVEFLANWITAILAQIVLVQTVLGVFGWLNSWSTLIVLGGVFFVSLVLFKRANGTFQIPAQWGKDLQSIAQFLRKEKSAQVVLLLVVWILLGFSIAALAEPSTLWDAFAYHLPMAVDWMQNQRLQPSYIPWADVSNSYFPGNGELLYLWALAPFHNDLLVRVVSVCMWLVLAIALFRVCRKVGASGQASLVATILFLFTPIVLSQATQLTLDMTSAAIFLLALGYLLEFEQSRRLEPMTLFSVASGLFWGIKYSGPAYLLLLLGGLFFVFVWRRRKFPVWVILGYCTVFAVGTTIFGGYWYIRNLILAGNPVYPLQISLMGQVILPGAFSSSHYQSRRLLDHLGDIPVLDWIRATLRGVGFPYLSLLTMSVFLLIERLYRYRDRVTKRSWLAVPILLLGFIVGSLALYLNTPYSIMRFGDAPITINSLAEGMRLGMVALALCVILVALGLSHRPKLLGVLWLILPVPLAQSLLFGHDLSVHSFFSGKLMSIQHSIVAGAIVAVGVLVYYAWTTHKPLFNLPRYLLQHYALILVMVVTLVVGGGLYRVEQHRERFRYGIYRRYGDFAGGWEWVAQNVHDARVAFAGFHLSYPLYGVNFQNEARYINIVGGLDDRYHDYEPFSYRKNGSYDVWLHNLEEWGSQYLVLSGMTEEEEWATEHPEVFSLVFDNPQIRVYFINAALDK
ncbi:MAG: hypothetical protein KKC18_16270 [Chloroflexi bacterium]|nr:hypothetical protein [Chloroflexota bacterium]